MKSIGKKRKPVRVLVIDEEEENAVNLWRCRWPLGQLAKDYPDEVQITFSTGRHNLADYRSYHVVFLLRATEADAHHVISNARKCGCAVVIDVDDNVFETPYWHPHFADYTLRSERMQANYMLADQVWLSTPALNDKFAKLPPFVERFVFPNAVMPRELPDRPSAPGAHVMLRASSWQGGDYRDAEDDFIRYDKFVEKWSFVGWWPPWPITWDKTDIHGKIPNSNFHRSIREIAPNVLWKPLQRNEFSKCKSNIAAIEATISGAACCTSYAGEWGWQTCTADLSEALKNQAEIFHSTRKLILEHFSLPKVNEGRLEALRKLT